MEQWRASRHLAHAPNPFRASTVLGFSLESPGRVRLEVVDVRGRRVAVLEDGRQGAGYSLSRQRTCAIHRCLPG